MNSKSLRSVISTAISGAVLFAGLAAPAGAVERSLLGIHIYSNVRAVLLKFGNPTYVLTNGQTISSVSSGTGAAGPGIGGQGMRAPGMAGPGMGGPGMGGPGMSYSPQGPRGGEDRGGGGQFGGPNGPYGAQIGPGAGNMSLPPLQPSAGPVSAFGMGGDDAGVVGPPGQAQTSTNGEVTLVFLKGDRTYQFLLSPHGTVIQITALGYADPAVKTSRGVSFGTSYTQIEHRYGYPESQSETNGVEILDYSSRAHVAFELLNSQVVGVVVAAV